MKTLTLLAIFAFNITSVNAALYECYHGTVSNPLEDILGTVSDPSACPPYIHPDDIKKFEGQYYKASPSDTLVNISNKVYKQSGKKFIGPLHSVKEHRIGDPKCRFLVQDLDI